MGLKVKSIEPIWGDTYKAGYVGFTYFNTSVVSRGIAFMTRWARMSDIKVSHALIVVGRNRCVEADLKRGVVRSNMKTKYFDAPECQIFFRKPVGLNDQIAEGIVAAAQEEVGTKYDIKLIASQAAQGTFVGKLINSVFRGKPDRLVSKRLNRDDRWICSELVAHCLNEQKAYRNKGILRHPSETIDPQELFEDAVIFEPWKYEA